MNGPLLVVMLIRQVLNDYFDVKHEKLEWTMPLNGEDGTFLVRYGSPMLVSNFQ